MDQNSSISMKPKTKDEPKELVQLVVNSTPSGPGKAFHPIPEFQQKEAQRENYTTDGRPKRAVPKPNYNFPNLKVKLRRPSKRKPKPNKNSIPEEAIETKLKPDKQIHEVKEATPNKIFLKDVYPRSTRQKSQVDYKLPSLRTKLRRPRKVL
ncbi:hypothetical protein DSO57_1034313 [Entomophthora muscae]|uniref:Uncharacterized protein n=1 Tax=Entomophthora muscae TaxID=34485 RepID=A0ACC2SP02_9FUNG|nr:hypothetical protein DSO57_1034313 [Entomophthora muscae]